MTTALLAQIERLDRTVLGKLKEAQCDLEAAHTEADKQAARARDAEDDCADACDERDAALRGANFHQDEFQKAEERLR